MKIDKVDDTILNALKNNSRTSNTDIAKSLKMAPSGILERIRKLIERNVIERFTIIPNYKKINLPILAYVTIQAEVVNWSAKCGDLLSKIHYAEEVHEVLGKNSYLVKLRAKDIDHLSAIIKDEISVIEEVKYTNTILVTQCIKNEPVLPKA